MNNQEPMSQAPGGIEAVEMSFTERLTGIYFEPRKTFESINRKPTWVVMFLIVCALAIGVTYTLTARMDYETYMRKAMATNPFTRNIPEEQIQAALARPQSAIQKYLQLGMVPVAILVSYLVLAGVFLMVFVLMGGTLPYKKSLAVTVWGMGPPSIIVTVLSIVFMLVKDPQTLDVNPAGNVVSNLGLLASPQEQPVLASLLSSIDVFSFWTIFLLAVGFAVCSGKKMSTGKAASGIIVLWLIYVVGKAWFLS